MDGTDTARKLAFAGALVAGIAYFGASILRDAFSSSSSKKTSKKRHNSDVTDSATSRELVATSGLSHASSQTDLTLPVGTREKLTAFRNVPPEMWAPWAKSIQERIRELNIRMVNSAGFVYNRTRLNEIYPNQLPSPSFRSLQNTPRHSPRSRSPESTTSSQRSFQSSLPTSVCRSTDDLRTNHNNASHLTEPKLISARSATGLSRVVDGCVPSATEVAVHRRRLEQMFGQTNSNLSQQEASSLTVLLLSGDQDLVVRSLSVIANCAAFTANIDAICDSGCVLLLPDLLDHHDVAVQVAATQAVANVGMSERGQEVLKDCIPVLVDRLKNGVGELQLNWTLMALANLAMKDANQHAMTPIISRLFEMLLSSTPTIRLQTAKLLVNLSCNSFMVPHLLAAKAPSNFFSLLDPHQDGELLLRFCHMLANVIEVCSHRDIRPQDLPTQFKAASPETLYASVFGFGAAEKLVRRLNVLKDQVGHEDTKLQVRRILNKVR